MENNKINCPFCDVPYVSQEVSRGCDYTSSIYVCPKCGERLRESWK
jgi:transposase-like protein